MFWLILGSVLSFLCILWAWKATDEYDNTGQLVGSVFACMFFIGCFTTGIASNLNRNGMCSAKKTEIEQYVYLTESLQDEYVSQKGTMIDAVNMEMTKQIIERRMHIASVISKFNAELVRWDTLQQKRFWTFIWRKREISPIDIGGIK